MKIPSFGIDVSSYQKNINYEQAAEAIDWVIIRGSLGGTGPIKDGSFETHYKQFKKLGVPVGAYHYLRGTSVEHAKNAAKFFYKKCLKGKSFEMPVFVDVEGDVLKVGKQLLTDMILTFIHTLESHGYYCGIYSSRSFFDYWFYDKGVLDAYPHWIAEYSRSCKYEPTLQIGMWQYGNESHNYFRNKEVGGVVCDQNFGYVDYPAYIIEHGVNGYMLKGDVDGNGKVDANDYLLAKRIWFGTYNPTAEEFARADMDGDGKIGVFDLLRIKRKALK